MRSKRKLSLKSTFFSLLGYEEAPPETPHAERLESLRFAMLEALGHDGFRSHPYLGRKLRFAEDVQVLWYARSELMAALASLHGETRARQELDQLSSLFQGLLPPGLTQGTGPGKTPG